MKISVTRGEVPIRNVLVKSHLEGRVYSISISTPLDKHPIVTLGAAVVSNEKLAQRVELHRARRTAAEFNPSIVELMPETPREENALYAGLFEIDWNRWGASLLAIPLDYLAHGTPVQAWEEFERGGAEYLGS